MVLAESKVRNKKSILGQDYRRWMCCLMPFFLSFSNGDSKVRWARFLGIGAGCLTKARACTFGSRVGFEWAGGLSQVVFSSDLHEVGGVHAGQVHTPWACRKGCAQHTTIQGNDGDTDSFAIPEPEDDNDSAILESPDKSSDFSPSQLLAAQGMFGN